MKKPNKKDFGYDGVDEYQSYNCAFNYAEALEKYIETLENKDKETIDEHIQAIMYHDGPDQHCDGSDIITDYVHAILNGKDAEWIAAYELKIQADQQKAKEYHEKLFGKK
jgi:hypothetical protein